jgi:hypothetical protein
MDKGTKRLIGQLLITGVVVVAIFEVHKRLKKNGDEKSNIFGRKPSAKENCEKQLGCKWDSKVKKCNCMFRDTVSFNGRNPNSIVEHYKSPSWVVG